MCQKLLSYYISHFHTRMTSTAIPRYSLGILWLVGRTGAPKRPEYSDVPIIKFSKPTWNWQWRSSECKPGGFFKPRVCGFDGLQTRVPGYPGLIMSVRRPRPVLTVSLQDRVSDISPTGHFPYRVFDAPGQIPSCNKRHVGHSPTVAK